MRHHFGTSLSNHLAGTEQSVQCLFYHLDNPDFELWQRKTIFLFSRSPVRLWGSPSILLHGHGSLSLEGSCGVVTLTQSFMFEFPCIVSLYYIRNQQYATLAVLFISHCKITLRVSDAFCIHHQEC